MCGTARGICHGSSSESSNDGERCTPRTKARQVQLFQFISHSVRRRLNQQLEAEIDQLGSDQSEAEITDLPFKNVGQVMLFLNKRLRQIQQTMDRIK